jgi:hypothetical protein
MSVIIQLRRGTASEWTSANPILAIGEFALELDTKRFKIGDGTTLWTALTYSSLDVNLTGGTNISITNDYEISLDSNVNVTSISASTIYSGSTDLSNIFATTADIPTTIPYDLVVAASDETTVITTGPSKVTFISPATFTLTGITASLTTTGSTASIIDVNYNGASVFASPLTIPSGEYYSATTTSTSAIAQYGKFTVDIDTAGTDATGLKVIFLGNRIL